MRLLNFHIELAGLAAGRIGHEGKNARSDDRIGLFGRNLAQSDTAKKHGQHGQHGQHDQQTPPIFLWQSFCIQDRIFGEISEALNSKF